jgi:hypothetical protein
MRPSDRPSPCQIRWGSLARSGSRLQSGPTRVQISPPAYYYFRSLLWSLSSVPTELNLQGLYKPPEEFISTRWFKMKLSNVLLGLLLALSVGFLASALLYSPAENYMPDTPEKVQVYCAEEMKDKPNILCVGKWTLDENRECAFVCGGSGDEMLMGGDSDAHGCKASAGYSWCESKQKCVRMWEEECMCAGIAGFKCPAGFRCNMSADYPDASGTCVQEY